MAGLLITGSTGYLAHRLLTIAAGYGPVLAGARNPDDVRPHQRKGELKTGGITPVALDITDQANVLSVFNRLQPDAVIHAAASNPGSSENSMDQVNHLGAATIAKACTKAGCRLVSVSTDVVFAGDSAPYADDAVASPLDANEYGRTKALGEQAIVAAAPGAAIVRTSLIYGLEQMDRGTAGFVERLGRGEELNLFSDVLRQPVWIDALSHALCRLAVEKTSETGFINVAGSEVMSRAEFGLRLLEHWNAKPANGINLISGADIKGLPMDLRVSLKRARSLGFAVPGVEEVLSGNSFST